MPDTYGHSLCIHWTFTGAADLVVVMWDAQCLPERIKQPKQIFDAALRKLTLSVQAQFARLKPNTLQIRHFATSLSKPMFLIKKLDLGNEVAQFSSKNNAFHKKQWFAKKKYRSLRKTFLKTAALYKKMFFYEKTAICFTKKLSFFRKKNTVFYKRIESL